jgi:hypothetical protein
VSDPEQLLRDALRHRADLTPYDATPVGDAEAGAHRLRRRRRATAVAGAVLAVAAVTVPVAVVTGRDSAAPPPASSSPTPTPSTTTTRPDLTPPTGAAPRVAYAAGRRIHEPDGDTFVLPRGLGVSGFAPYRGGYLVADARYFEGTVGLSRYDADGREVASWTTSGVPVGSPDGSLAAWTSFVEEGSGSVGPTLVHLGSSSGPEHTQELDLDRPTVVGLLEGEVVLQPAFADGTWVTDLESAPRRLAALDRATDVNATQGLVAGTADGGELGRVVQAATGEVVWERRGVSVGSFSPDGRYAVTTREDDGRREIVDARSGAPVAVVEASGEDDFPTLLELSWEDDGHLLGDLVLDCCTHLARVDLDGTVETALDGGIGGAGFVFAATS